VTRRPPAWIALTPLLGVVACANVWGFDDLTSRDGGPQDATTRVDAFAPPVESGPDAADDGVGDVADSSGDASDAMGTGEGGEGGESDATAREGGPGDAGNDGATAAECKASCQTGCCDANNHCQAGSTPSICGSSGGACQDCSSHSCGTLQATCCVSGACACEPLTCP